MKFKDHMRCARRHGYFVDWYLEQLDIQSDHFQQFFIRLYDVYVHLLQYFFTWKKKSFSHDLCYGKTAGRLWCILTFSSMSLCSNFKFHFITQMYILSNIFTRKKKSFSHHLRYGKSAWPFMMTPIMGRPDGTYGDNWDLPQPNFVENSLIHHTN